MSTQQIKNRISWGKIDKRAFGIDCDEVHIGPDTLAIFNNGSLIKEVRLNEVTDIKFIPKSDHNLCC